MSLLSVITASWAPAGPVSADRGPIGTDGTPVGVVVAGALAGVMAGWFGFTMWDLWRRRDPRRRDQATGPVSPSGGAGVWLAITAPVAMPADGPTAIWAALAGVLRRARPGRFGARARLAVEWWADPAGIRPGVWVPEGVSPRQVAGVITRTWPGARVVSTSAPLWHTPPRTVLELAPTGGHWAPLTDHRTGPSRPREGVDEPLRAVLAGLADRAPGEQACLQIVIRPARSWLPARMQGLAGTGGAGLLRAVCPPLLDGLAGAAAASLLAVLDLLATPPGRTHGRGHRGHLDEHRYPGHHRHHGRSGDPGRGDPAVAAAMKAREAKRASGPHLHTTIRIAVAVRSARTREAGQLTAWARGVAAAIAAGYDLVTTTPLRGRWRRHPAIIQRRVPGAGFLASIAELGACWHLPSEAARYGLPQPFITARRPPPETPVIDTTPGTRPEGS